MNLYFFKSAKEKDAAKQVRRMFEHRYKKGYSDDPDELKIVPRMKDADYIVACGGDGTFLELEQLKAHRPDLKASLIGVACGTVNHLMNQVDDLDQFIKSAKTFIHHPLRATCITGDGYLLSKLAANDVTIHRSSPFNQSCHLDVRIGCGRSQIRGEINGDGLVAASIQGLNAYYRNAGGQFIHMWSATYGVQPICDIRAQNLSRVIPNDNRIIVDVKDYEKRPVAVFVDNLPAIKNVVRCEIEMDTDINIPVLVNHKTPFVKVNQRLARQHTRV